MFDKQIFSKRVKELLNERSIRQADLANAIKITPQTLSKYLGGKQTPTIDFVMTVADYLSVSADWLLGRTEIRDCSAPVSELTTSADAIELSLRLCDAASATLMPVQYYIDSDSSLYNIKYGSESYQREGRHEERTYGPYDATVIIIQRQDIVAFSNKYRKMIALLKEGTIDEDLYSTWLNGEISKLKDSKLSDDDLPF